MSYLDTIAAIASISLVFFNIFPFVASWYYESRIYFYFGLATIGTLIFNGLLKQIFRPQLSNAFKRPAAAADCNSWNKGGKCGDKAGFPSGHTQMAMFVTLFLYLLTKKKWVLITGLIWTILVAWSRIHRHCHTILQVIFGGIFGIIYTYGIYRLFEYFELL